MKYIEKILKWIFFMKWKNIRHDNNKLLNQDIQDNIMQASIRLLVLGLLVSATSIFIYNKYLAPEYLLKDLDASITKLNASITKKDLEFTVFKEETIKTFDIINNSLIQARNYLKDDYYAYKVAYEVCNDRDFEEVLTSVLAARCEGFNRHATQGNSLENINTYHGLLSAHITELTKKYNLQVTKEGTIIEGRAR